MQMTPHTRRDFMRLACCSAATAGMVSGLSKFGLVSAMAQSSTDYKALVCVFLFGGNDSNNMIVPIDSRYAAYRTMRGPVALAADCLRPGGTRGFGLHPALANLQRLYDQQAAAMVFNVGTLVQPTTKDTLDRI